jgi:hypothetical protein
VSFDDFCNLDGFLKQFDKDDESKKDKVTKGKVAKVDGKDAVPISSTDKDGNKTTGWVAVDGKHHVLKMETGGAQAGTIVPSDFDKPLDLQKPAADEAFDASKLGS